MIFLCNFLSTMYVTELPNKVLGMKLCCSSELEDSLLNDDASDEADEDCDVEGSRWRRQWDVDLALCLRPRFFPLFRLCPRLLSSASSLELEEGDRLRFLPRRDFSEALLLSFELLGELDREELRDTLYDFSDTRFLPREALGERDCEVLVDHLRDFPDTRFLPRELLWLCEELRKILRDFPDTCFLPRESLGERERDELGETLRNRFLIFALRRCRLQGDEENSSSLRMAECSLPTVTPDVPGVSPIEIWLGLSDAEELSLFRTRDSRASYLANSSAYSDCDTEVSCS